MSSSGSRTELLAFVALLAMTAAWGSTFFLIHDIVDRIPVTDLLAVRFGIASLGLVLFAGRQLRMSRRTVRDGVLLGLLYAGAQLLQTFGLAHTAASVSGFLTGLYVVLTPLLAALVLRTRVTPAVWLAVGLATVGLGVLSLDGFAIGFGEALTVVSALVYAGHILLTGRVSTPGAAISLSLVQAVSITVVCALAAVWPSGGPGVGLQLPGTAYDWGVVVYLGLVAGALAMVLQTWAQARVEASRAAVVMAMEPVWAAAFAVALGGERITVRMVVGGLAILTAMYVVERPRPAPVDSPVGTPPDAEPPAEKSHRR